MACACARALEPTWHPLDEHEEVTGLARGAETAHDVRVVQLAHHLDLRLHRLAHLPLLVLRVAAKRDL